MVGRDAGEGQAAFGAGDGHVKRIEFFAALLVLLGCQQIDGARRRVAFAGQKDEAARRGRFARPVDEGAHGVGFGRGGLGVQQQHGVRFQPLGAVNGEQAHGVARTGCGRQGGRAAFAQGAHKGPGGQKAAALQVERQRQQAAQLRQRALALVRRGGCGVAGKGVAVVEDGLQRVVRGQAGQPGLVEGQIGCQIGRQIACQVISQIARQRLPIGREQLFFL